jgi:hypothetical protein
MSTIHIPTERDENMIRLVDHLGCADANQICLLTPGSDQNKRRRLKWLTDENYLQRIYVHAQNFAELRSRPRVYVLTPKGAKFLARNNNMPLKHVQSQLKRAGHVFVNHTLQVTATMIHFITAADKAGWKVLDHFDLRPQFPPRTDKRGKRNPFSLSVTLGGEDRALIPDRLFSLHHDRYRLNFCLEQDQMSEPIHRTFIDTGTHLTDKIRLYWRAWQDNAHRDAWGFKQLRVLFVTPSEKRISNIQARVATQKIISNLDTKLFLFTTPKRLTDEGAFAPIWDTLTPGPPISPLESIPQASTVEVLA